MPTLKKYWLLKSEPESFSIDDLAQAPQQTTCWSGVRNYQARNFMRDEMHLGDEVLYYHSNAEPSAVVGTAVVVCEAYPDHTQFDPKSDYFDPKATPANPVLQMVDIRLQQVFAAPLPIERLRTVPVLKNMELLRRGSRLSVQPVSKAEFETILALAKDATVTAAAKSKPAKTANSKTVVAPKKSAKPRRVTRAKK